MSYTQAQINAMTTAQWVAAGGPVAIDAPYSDTYDPLMQDPAYNPSAVTSGTLQQGTAPASPSGLGAFPGSLSQGIDNILGQAAPSTSTAPAASSQSSGGGLSGFLSFIGNPARIGTVVVGGLMIAAGIFALSRGSGVTINMPAGGQGSTEAGKTGHANQSLHVKF